MSSVKIMGGPIKEPPKPTKYADIEGQGRIPYATLKDEKTPNTAKAKVTKASAVVWVLHFVVLNSLMRR